jgi:hypothetical protein
VTKRKPIESYSDALKLLDKCIEHRGIRLPYPTAKAAVTMRHRLYRARLTYFETTSNPQYNDIYIQLVYKDGTAQGPGNLIEPMAPADLVLRLHSEKPLPQITDLDGNPISPLTTKDDESLEQAVSSFARKLSLE